MSVKHQTCLRINLPRILQTGHRLTQISLFFRIIVRHPTFLAVIVTIREAKTQLGATINLAMQTTRIHRVEQVLKVSQHLCEVYSIKMYATESRRHSDVITLSLWGERQDVLKLPFKLLEYLPDEDIELLQSGRRGSDYLLLLVITERLIGQSIHMPERRAKLRGKFERSLLGS